MSSVFTRSFTALGALTLVAMAGAPAEAEVLRLNTPAVGLTIDRIGALPDAERGAWADYLARSQAAHLADRAALAAELPAGATPPSPPLGTPHPLPYKRVQYRKPLQAVIYWFHRKQAAVKRPLSCCLHCNYCLRLTQKMDADRVCWFSPQRANWPCKSRKPRKPTDAAYVASKRFRLLVACPTQYKIGCSKWGLISWWQHLDVYSIR